MNLQLESDWTSNELYLVASKGYSLYLQGRYREAAIVFMGLMAIEPRNRYFRVALATIYVSQEDFERALDQLNQLVARYPNDLEARARRCEVYLRLERRKEAQDDLNYLSRREVSHVGRLRLLMGTFLSRRSRNSSEAT